MTSSEKTDCLHSIYNYKQPFSYSPGVEIFGYVFINFDQVCSKVSPRPKSIMLLVGCAFVYFLQGKTFNQAKSVDLHTVRFCKKAKYAFCKWIKTGINKVGFIVNLIAII